MDTGVEGSYKGGIRDDTCGLLHVAGEVMAPPAEITTLKELSSSWGKTMSCSQQMFWMNQDQPIRKLNQVKAGLGITGTVCFEQHPGTFSDPSAPLTFCK